MLDIKPTKRQSELTNDLYLGKFKGTKPWVEVERCQDDTEQSIALYD
jgi:hypothetical protein